MKERKEGGKEILKNNPKSTQTKEKDKFFKHIVSQLLSSRSLAS